MLVTVMDKHDMLTGATHDNTMEVKLDYTHVFLILNMSLQPLMIRFSVHSTLSFCDCFYR